MSRNNFARKTGKRKSSDGAFAPRGFGGTKHPHNRSGSASRSSNRSSGRAHSKFNPSDFIKKVEEQVATPAYEPKHTFNDFLIDDSLKKNIAARGYVSPTPIQDQAIPFILEGKDLIGTANTGTGKTAAFLIPLLDHVITKKIQRVLIITPTRELATQIKDELNLLKGKLNIQSVLCIGGLNINFQIQKLKKPHEFVIGTPGRLKDLEDHNALVFSRYDAIVLDEVDTMLDMGFIKDIRYIVSRLPHKRHSLFFSATISPEVKLVMNGFLQNPVTVSVKSRQSAENVNQDVIKIGDKIKIEVLHDLLNKPEFTRVIIFSRTKRATDKLAKALRDRGFIVTAMHGDKTQSQRQKSLELFKAGKVKILLATDVVARGIDIDDVSHVINYDMPATHEDYIHRIGRTGRANKIGQAITFVD